MHLLLFWVEILDMLSLSWYFQFLCSCGWDSKSGVQERSMKSLTPKCTVIMMTDLTVSRELTKTHLKIILLTYFYKFWVDYMPRDLQHWLVLFGVPEESFMPLATTQEIPAKGFAEHLLTLDCWQCWCAPSSLLWTCWRLPISEFKIQTLLMQNMCTRILFTVICNHSYH